MRYKVALVLGFVLALAVILCGQTIMKKKAIPPPVWKELHRVDGDNAPQIMEAWNSGLSPYLVDPGDWEINQNLEVPRDSVGLAIGGNSKARLTPVLDRHNRSGWVKNGNYFSVIWAFDVLGFVVQDISLNLTELSMEDYFGASAISLWRADYSAVRNVKIYGASYDGTSPWQNGGDWGGVCITYSSRVEVSDCYFRDIGCVSRQVGASIPYEAIRIVGSSRTRVLRNQIIRVAIAIELVGTERLEYDSSNTEISDNEIVGVDESSNPNTPSSRGIKVQVCGSEITPTPVTGVKILRNHVSHAGGHNGLQGGVGIYIICGLQYSEVADNVVDGCGLQEYGLELASDYYGHFSDTVNNTFHNNDIKSGRGRVPCYNGCWDVGFTSAPDQIGLGKNDPGDNILRTRSIRR